MKQIFILIFILLCTIFIVENSNAQRNKTLEQYVQEGLKNNIVLQQKKISYEKAVYSLRSATSLFFPSIELQASYTSGDGGRSIDIPVGDLVNPVYQILNQLTGTNRFPQIQNVKESFFPNQFYDAYVRTSMPILNTDIILNRQIENSQLQIKEFEVDLYKRELVKEIKTAYFNYLSALDAVNIYSSALDLAKEGKRINESLLRNGSGLPVYVIRSEGEIENLNALISESQTKSENAKRYFNFLLNRQLDFNVDVISIDTIDENISDDISMVEWREEIKILNSAIDINKSILNLNEYYFVPKISAFVDLGVQDSRWNYSKDSRYYLFGFQLNVPLFEGFRNRNKIEIADLELKSSELELQKTANALSLSISISKNDLMNAIKNHQSSLKQLSTAQSYYNLISRGYQEGANTFIEMVDARSQLRSEQLSVNINKYKIFIARANYEFETASLNINE